MYEHSVSVLRDTFAAAYNEILINTAKRTPDDELTLLLPHKPPDNFRGFQINQVDFAIGHIDEHILRIPADIHASHPTFHQDAVFFPAGLEVVDNNLAFAGDDDHPLAVGRDGNILYTIFDFPVVD